MYNKLISLHVACGLLLATGVAFGMEKKSSLPKNRLYLVANYTRWNGEDRWLFYGQSARLAEKITKDHINTTSEYNYSLRYNETKQTLCTGPANLPMWPLTHPQLSREQISLAKAMVQSKHKTYVNIDNKLYPLVEVKEIPESF